MCHGKHIPKLVQFIHARVFSGNFRTCVIRTVRHDMEGKCPSDTIPTIWIRKKKTISNRDFTEIMSEKSLSFSLSSFISIFFHSFQDFTTQLHTLCGNQWGKRVFTVVNGLRRKINFIEPKLNNRRILLWLGNVSHSTFFFCSFFTQNIFPFNITRSQWWCISFHSIGLISFSLPIFLRYCYYNALMIFGLFFVGAGICVGIHSFIPKIRPYFQHEPNKANYT